MKQDAIGVKTMIFPVSPKFESAIIKGLKNRMIKDLDSKLEVKGRLNLRKLFLLRIDTISEMERHIKFKAPELKVYFYRELHEFLKEVEAGQDLGQGFSKIRVMK